MRHDAILDEIEMGEEMTVWLVGGCGQGGRRTDPIGAGSGVAVIGPDGVRHEYALADTRRFDVERPGDPTECLEYGEDGAQCSGPVELWWAGGERSWPRCTFHGERRLNRYENGIERYAESDVEPDWFDPTIAGERWSEDY